MLDFQPNSVQPPPNAVTCARCKSKGIVMICTDPHCVVQNECIHAQYEDCSVCQKQGWIE